MIIVPRVVVFEQSVRHLQGLGVPEYILKETYFRGGFVVGRRPTARRRFHLGGFFIVDVDGPRARGFFAVRDFDDVIEGSIDWRRHCSGVDGDFVRQLPSFYLGCHLIFRPWGWFGLGHRGRGRLVF